MVEYSIIGKSLPRVDALEKVTGQTKFSGDIIAPGMLYGKMKRSPHPHATILNIDVSKAKSLKGVKGVITANEIPNPIRLGMSVLDQPVLAENKVRYIGDPVCAVAAVDEDTAEEALERIKIDYELLPAVFDPEEAMREGAPKVHEAEKNIAGIRRVVKGNIEEGLKEADYVFEDRFTTQGVDQVPLETDTAVAMFDADGHLKMWFATHSPFVQIPIMARMLGISEEKIKITVPSLGGSFGGKSQVLIGYICAALARVCDIDHPVKMTHSREEEFMCSTIRHPSVVSLKTGVKRDGKIVARQANYILNTGAYTHTGDLVVQWAGMCFSGVYKTPHLLFNGYCVYTNSANAGSFRGFGNPQLTFAVESQMDMISERLGIDPVELRLINAMEKGDKMATGWGLRSCGLKECIREAAKTIEWSKGATQKRRGIGIACGNHGSGWRIDQKTAGASYDTDASTCILRVNAGGGIDIYTGETEEGQGAKTVLTQIAAEELGVEFDKIRLKLGDTADCPFGRGAFSSRTTLIAGRAVQSGAANMKKQLLEIAGHLFEASVEDLELKDGKVFVKGRPFQTKTVADISKHYIKTKGGYITATGYYDPDSTIPDPETGQGSLSAAFIFFAHACEVEVDMETGDVKIIRYVAVHDVGKGINPMAIEGQIEGAMVQGLGYALSEELKLKDGLVLNPDFSDYVMFPVEDVPPIQIKIIEDPEPTGPFGAKGVGEPALVATAPAIANAIYNAIGIRIKSLPITPQKILDAIRGKNDTV